MDKDSQNSDKPQNSLPADQNTSENKRNTGESNTSSNTSTNSTEQLSSSSSQNDELKNRFETEFTELFAVLVNEKKNPGIHPTLKQYILTNAMSAFTNMQMAHEISINSDYKIVPVEKPDSVETRVTDMMKKAYWDLVNEDLEKDPPVHEHAIKVFDEIRENMLALLMPHNSSVRLLIEETLNMDDIRRQVEHEALDFQRYVNFVVDCLARICSPQRDAQVEEIRRYHKPSEVFRRLFEVMEMMRLDMANFYLTCARPRIIEHCVSYERIKFIEFMELEYEVDQDGLRNTRDWLLRHAIDGRNTPTTIAKAFAEMMEWNPEHPWPETLALDQVRITNLAQALKRVTLFSAMSFSVIEICRPFLAKTYPIYSILRSEMDQRFRILLPMDHMGSNEHIIDDIEACAEESVRVVEYHYKIIFQKPFPERIANMIRQAVKDVLRPDNKVRSLLVMRIMQFVEESLLSDSRTDVVLNPGLSSIQADVEKTTTEFCRIITHNRNAYNDIYCDIIEGKGPVPVYNNPEYLLYLQQLKATHRSNTSMSNEHLPGTSRASRNEESQPTQTTSNAPLKSGHKTKIAVLPDYILGLSESSSNASDVSVNATTPKNLKHPRTQSISTPPEDDLPGASADASEVTTEKKSKTSQVTNTNGASSENIKTPDDELQQSSNTSMTGPSKAVRQDKVLGFSCDNNGDGSVETLWSSSTLEMTPSKSEHLIIESQESGQFPQTSLLTKALKVKDSSSTQYTPSLPILLQENHFSEESSVDFTPLTSPNGPTENIYESYSSQYSRFKSQNISEILDFDSHQGSRNEPEFVRKQTRSSQSASSRLVADDPEGVNCKNNRNLKSDEIQVTAPISGEEIGNEVLDAIITAKGVAKEEGPKASNGTALDCPDPQGHSSRQNRELEKSAEKKANPYPDK